MQAQAAGAGLPLLARLVAAEPGELRPRCAAVGGAEQRGVLDAGEDSVGIVGEGSRCQTRANSHGCCVPSYH